MGSYEKNQGRGGENRKEIERKKERKKEGA